MDSYVVDCFRALYIGPYDNRTGALNPEESIEEKKNSHRDTEKK
jgi:hypothetical protein